MLIDWLTVAAQEAWEKRDQLVQEARQKLDTMKEEWQNALEKEKASFLERFQKQTARVSTGFALSEKQQASIQKVLSKQPYQNQVKNSNPLPFEPGTPNICMSGVPAVT